ncbi:acyl-protein thioesterase [Biscogniauxia mediterranea]|nr:acyl-protein thioesterase [Biscogniauxia mediterranea]
MEKHTSEKSDSSLFVIEPVSQHKYSLILLHGLNSSGERFGKEFIESSVCFNGKRLVDILPGARFIFPTSKKRRSAAFRRAMLRQWFDIASLDEPSYRQDTQSQGLSESCPEILKIIDEECQKIGRENAVVGGLSQGCAMGLSCLLALHLPLGGFIGMSGWLPFQHDIERIAKDEECQSDDNPFNSDTDDPFTNPNEPSPVTQDPIVRVAEFSRDLLCLENLDNTCNDQTSILTPVFLGHGEADDKIKCRFGKMACDTLVSCGFDVTWRSYPDQGHWYKVPDEIDDMVEFMQTKVGWHIEKAQ